MYHNLSHLYSKSHVFAAEEGDADYFTGCSIRRQCVII